MGVCEGSRVKVLGFQDPGTGESRVQGLGSRYLGVQVPGGPGILKNAALVRNFQIQLFGEEIWGKTAFLKIT